MWACNGFKGVSVSKVRVEDSWHYWAISNTVGFQHVKEWSWTYILKTAIALKVSQNSIKGCSPIPMNEKQAAKAIQLLNSGSLVMEVEYRKHEIREARKYIDGRASLSEKTYYTQHFCEGGGKPILIEEQLPDTYRVGDKVEPPMKKGQTAVFEITRVRDFNKVLTYQGNFHAVT